MWISFWCSGRCDVWFMFCCVELYFGYVVFYFFVFVGDYCCGICWFIFVICDVCCLVGFVVVNGMFCLQYGV